MTAKDDTTPAHPGAILTAELKELGLTPDEFDVALALPTGTTAEIRAQRSSVTPGLALRLGRYFGTTPRFWMNLQNAYDLKIAEREHGPAIIRQVKPRVFDPSLQAYLL